MWPRLTTICFKLLIVFVIITAMITTKSASAAEKRPLLNGTFIQLLKQNEGWNRSRLENLFDSFQSIGLQQVVVQWTLFDNKAFFNTTTFAQVELPPLETILELAETRGIVLYLGLAAESDYWNMIKQPPVGQEEYLNRLRWKSERVAQEVAVVASRYRSFGGWYIPEEIDDSTWRSPKSRKLLYQHLIKLTRLLKELTPTKTIMLSCFSSARMAPDSYQEFWQALLDETSIDVLLFQDGAGTGILPRKLLPLYLNAVRRATYTTNRKLQIAIELFTVISESPFKATPASISRIRKQLLIADDYATDGINSFSVPDYMLRTGDAAAAELLRDYQKYKGGGHLE